MSLRKLIGSYDETNANQLSVVELINNRHAIFSEEQVEKLDVVLEIVSEYLKYKADDVRVTSPEGIFNAVIEMYIKADISREHFGIVLFDNKMHVISSEILFSGSRDSSIIDFSTIVRKAVLSNATAVALIHNHPSGDCKPSVEDIDVTHRVDSACRVFNIQLVDHIIIGGVKSYTSWRENDWL